MTKIRKIIIAAAAVTAVTAGSAFTAGITSLPVSRTVAYGTSAIDGPTAVSIVYAMDVGGATIDTVTVVFAGDQSAKDITAGFGDAPAALDLAGGAPTFDDPNTSIVFDAAGAATAAQLKFRVLVTD